jgi:predicted O-methyltransferase YrrM
MNIRGAMTDLWGTIRTIASLGHPHLFLMRLKGREHFLRYTAGIFRNYLQSIHPSVQSVSFSHMLLHFGIHPEAVEVSIPILQGYVGLSELEKLTLAVLARRFNSLPIFEIGTAAGSSTILLAKNTRQIVYTLDLPDHQEQKTALCRMRTDDKVISGRVRGAFIREARLDNIVELQGDSAVYDFSCHSDRIGLFFIDGAHSFQYVCSDTHIASHSCTADGILVWHDFGSSRGVCKFLDILASSGIRIFYVQDTTIAFSTDIMACREKSREIVKTLRKKLR